MLKKKVLSLLLIILGVLFLTSCSYKTVDDTSINSGEYITNREGGFADDVIKDEATALKYATVILENTLEKDSSSYKIQKATYDESTGMWIVNFFIDNNHLGGDVNFSISKKTGEIQLIWFGE